jgi:uncharacterized protein YgbK (DUF1537 family)
MPVGIQADDLTGACDTGAPFAARGYDTLVVVSDGDWLATLPPSTAAVLVVDTESRTVPVEEARARARRAGRALEAGPPRLLYKKVDSTLRGHVAAEIDAMLEGSGLPAALLAPAFPAQRRAVVDGCLHVDGRPAEATPIARDPGFPPTGGSLLALVVAGGVRPATPLPLATVRRGPAAVAARLRRFVEAGGRVLAADAEAGEDLAALAEAAGDGATLLAGSAGLATTLAARLPARGPGERGAAPARPRRPLVVVAGSAHPATRGQVGRLGRREGLEILAAPAPDGGADDPARRRETAARLAETARARLERDRPGTLLLTGGETAIGVLRLLGAGGIRLAGELEPGVALGTIAGGPFDGLVLVTKAGGFGDPDALLRVWEASA